VVSALRYPAAVRAGTKFESIMSVMDVFPTLAGAAGIETKNERRLDGRDLWAGIRDGKAVPRRELLFFASETPIRGSISTTAFDDEWKLVQEIHQGLLSAEVTNHLFRIDEDPYETNDLASEHPDEVARLAQQVHHWRSRYPVAGTRSELVPPPGWRAPKDWASYPVPIEALQAEPAPGMPPDHRTKQILDWQHGEAGRLLYDCNPYPWLGGGLCRD